MDAQQIAALSDDDYNKLVNANIHQRERDTAAWRILLSPEFVIRTHDQLNVTYQRVIGALRKRKAGRDVFQSECFKRGDAGKREWFETRPEYEEWRRRAVNFHRAVQDAMAEINKARKEANILQNDQVSHRHREALRELAVAVRDHQAEHARAGGVAEQPDYELWQALDRVTVPCGPGGRPVSLRSMLDVYWYEVEPETAVGRAQDGAERLMRSAPAGRSSRYGGIPEARHVHNDKTIA